MKHDARLGRPLEQAMRACRSYLVVAGLFSLPINLLYLASPLYMLQVYNRVATSGSLVTLLMLTIILCLALGSLALLDLVRARLLTRVGSRFENALSAAVFDSAFRYHASPHRGGPVRDLDTIRQTVSGPAMYPLFDLPWTPIFIIAAFLLHPWLGVFTLCCCLLLAAFAVLNEGLLRRPLAVAGVAAARSAGFAEMSLRNAEVVAALGMAPGVIRRWRGDRLEQIDRQRQAADRAGAMGSATKFMRLLMQSLALGIGAWLVVSHESSAGVMFAASLLLGRALQPLEQIIGSWRSLSGSAAALRRIADLLGKVPGTAETTMLPAPKGRLGAENLHFTLPGAPRLILRAVNFELDEGTALGVIGPSGSGKSSLARLLIGIATPSVGGVRLDGALIGSWPRQLLGRHIGYLPQDVELFAATIAANIARFEPDADADVIAAARLAGAHEAILQLPAGYDTEIGDAGTMLPGGIRQRVALARAVFRTPALVVLDEPSSNLDTAGDAALARCIAELKRLGKTVVVVSHRQSTLAVLDKILVLNNGGVQMFGPRDAVLAQTGAPAVAPAGEPGAETPRLRPMAVNHA